jgi:hypothetical protein
MKDKTKREEFERGKVELDYRASMAEIAKEISREEINRVIGITLIIGIAIGAICLGVGDDIKIA